MSEDLKVTFMIGGQPLRPFLPGFASFFVLKILLAENFTDDGKLICLKTSFTMVVVSFTSSVEDKTPWVDS